MSAREQRDVVVCLPHGWPRSCSDAGSSNSGSRAPKLNLTTTIHSAGLDRTAYQSSISGSQRGVQQQIRRMGQLQISPLHRYPWGPIHLDPPAKSRDEVGRVFYVRAHHAQKGRQFISLQPIRSFEAPDIPSLEQCLAFSTTILQPR